MTDKELEELGFPKFYLDHDIDKVFTKDAIFQGIKDEVENNGWFYILTKDRLKAGVEGARLGLAALEFLLRFFDLAQMKEFQVEVAIQNLKTFLGGKEK